MKFRPLHSISSREDDQDLNVADLAISPAGSHFMWGLVGSEAWPVMAVSDLVQVAEPVPAPDRPTVGEHPTAWALASLVADTGAGGGTPAEVFADVPNPADLVGDPLWTEAWGQSLANLRAMPYLVTGQTAAELADREHAISELCQQVEVERAGKPILPPSDPLDVNAWEFAGSGSLWTDNVSLIGSTRQEGPDVSLLSATGWI